MGITIRRMTKAEQTNEKNARARVGIRGSMLIVFECSFANLVEVLNVLEDVYPGSVVCWRSSRA